MAKLADVAQTIMDMYYADLKTDENYFDLDDFKQVAAAVYSRMLEQDYKDARLETKQEFGVTHVTLPAVLLTKVKVKVERVPDSDSYYADLPAMPFSFPNDAYGYGVQTVRNRNGKGCKTFIRTTQDILWQLCELPATSAVFFYSLGKQLLFENAGCGLEEIDVYYLPEITDPSFGEDGGEIPKIREEPVIARTLLLFRESRNGTVVDMTNNGNPNPIIQKEIDTVNQPLKTKP